MTVRPAPKPPRREKRPRKPLRKQGRAIARNSAPKKKRRTASEFQRIYGSKERVAWVKQQPCAVAGGWTFCDGPIQGHHIRTGGKGRKADARFIVPLCHGHHRALHTYGRSTFQEFYGVDLEAAAAETERLWQLRGGKADAPPNQEGTKGGHCSLCRYPIARGETVCGECACEDDSE